MMMMMNDDTTTNYGGPTDDTTTRIVKRLYDNSEEEMSSSQANKEGVSGSDVEPEEKEEPEVSGDESTCESGDVSFEFTPVVESDSVEVEEPSAPDS